MGGRTVPWSNGTEQEEWESKWCAYCTRDHAMHGDGTGPEAFCNVILDHDALAALAEVTGTLDWSWPTEVWVEIRGNESKRPAQRMVCLLFDPCTDGCCTGDPGAEGRAALFAEAEAGLRGTV